MPPDLYIGMISGTSRDGVDTVLVDLQSWPRLIAALCLPYPTDLADRLKTAIEEGSRPSDLIMAGLDPDLGEFFAHAAQTLMEQAGVKPGDIMAIGSHGQTVWHDPDSSAAETIQLGSPQLISDLTGVTTVGQFRQADLKAGGQGAPLAPLLHRALFRPHSGTRAVLNLGGIANVSLLDAGGNVLGFDTGPANCLLDAWVGRHLNVPFDADGHWAASGQIVPELLQALLNDPYFDRSPPKSTGVEYFNANWLDARLSSVSVARPENIQATLAELSAATIAMSLERQASFGPPTEILVCGGGVHNKDLLNRLRRLLPKTEVTSTAGQGLDPDWVEGVLFAWLARERLSGRPQDTRPITGAREPVLLGDVFGEP